MSYSPRKSADKQEKKPRVVVLHMGVHKLGLPESDYSEEEMIQLVQLGISEILEKLDIEVLGSWFSGIRTSQRYWILASKLSQAYGRFAGWMVRVLERLKEKI